MSDKTSRRDLLRGLAGGAAAASVCGWRDAVAAPTTALPLPSSWDMTVDLLVAGSGIAGMSAAIAAIDKGASVAVFEKDETYGGNAIIGGGIIALRGGTRFQREAGDKDTPQALYEHLTDLRNIEYRKNDPKLVKRYSEMCGGTQEWLEAHGVEFYPSQTKSGSYDSQHRESYLHMRSTEQGESSNAPQSDGGYRNGMAIMMPFRRYYEGKGGKIYFRHKLTDVYREDGGRVIGARIETPKGVLNVRANKGVMLAGGGWKANPELRVITDPRFTPDMIATGYPYTSPDGSTILAGLKVGGMYYGDRGEDTAHFRRGFGSETYRFKTGSKYGCPGVAMPGKRWAELVFVNKLGDRFMPEVERNDYGGYGFFDITMAQPDKIIWCVFDDATAQQYKIDTKFPVCSKGYAFDAPTLEELGAKLKIKKLPETIRRYNGFCDAGKDEDFGKPAEMLKKKIEQGPFHAIRLVLFVHNMTGGLRIDENAQVIDILGRPIPGLYSSGESAGCLFVGNGIPKGIMPSRFAVEHALKS